jgi:site-specific DNA-methyltransferase (adenine-specific)
VDREPIVVSPPPQAKRWKFEAYNGDMEFHPCQKPLDLMLWLVSELSEIGDIIVDPYMGSGTTLLAAKRLGRRAVGIEMSEAYCKIAVQRLGQKELFGIENGHGT